MTYYDTETGKLTDRGIETVNEHLRKLGLTACPTCKQRCTWVVEPYLGTIPAYSAVSKRFPVAIVRCDRCSVVFSFAAPGFTLSPWSA